VFYCKDKEQDLHNTRFASLYPSDGEGAGKGEKAEWKHQTIRQLCRLRPAKVVLYMPKAQLHEVNIWLRKHSTQFIAPSYLRRLPRWTRDATTLFRRRVLIGESWLPLDL